MKNSCCSSNDTNHLLVWYIGPRYTPHAGRIKIVYSTTNWNDLLRFPRPYHPQVGTVLSSVWPRSPPRVLALQDSLVWRLPFASTMRGQKRRGLQLRSRCSAAGRFIRGKVVAQNYVKKNVDVTIRQPHCYLTPPPWGTPANIRISPIYISRN